MTKIHFHWRVVVNQQGSFDFAMPLIGAHYVITNALVQPNATGGSVSTLGLEDIRGDGTFLPLPGTGGSIESGERHFRTGFGMSIGAGTPANGGVTVFLDGFIQAGD